LDEDDETLLFMTCHTAIFRKQQEVAMDTERMEERIADYLKALVWPDFLPTQLRTGV
jgi:hypothetical protein